MGIGRLHTSANPRFLDGAPGRLRRGCANADLFSCEALDERVAIAVLRGAFEPACIGWKPLDRGREFPEHIAASRAIVANDRRHVTRGLGLERPR